MGKKYIIEIPEDKIADFVGSTHFLMPYTMAGHIGHHDTGLPIEPYTEPDLEQARKEGYEKGLYDAWEAARKIVTMPDRDFINSDILDLDPGESIFAKYTASEAIEKIRQYEQEQQIRVGDEVGYYGVADEHGNVNYSGVVLEIRKDDYLVMEKNGKTYQLKKKLVMSKTGRHFPEIAAVLEKMRGDKE